jgi:hypothetical protein
MQLTADMILTDFGTNLPLDRRRKDALAALARRAAWAAGARSAQRWTEREWGLKDYEAKDLLKGNASEAVWERIVKHPRGGWVVVLPVMGAVIGQSLDDWLQDRLAAEERRLRLERERYERESARLGPMAREVAALLGVGARRAPEHDLGEHRSHGRLDGRVGDQDDARAVEPASFAPKTRGRG